MTVGASPPRVRAPARRRAERDRQIVGWREWVSLPQLGIDDIKVKVDTGARSSALHAIEVKIRPQGDRQVVHFKVHPVQRDFATTVTCRAPLHDHRWVRSSSGERQLRPVVLTTVLLGEQSWPIELTLTSRDLMGFRMLLGREAIRRRFVVDPGRSFLARPEPERRARPVPETIEREGREV